MRCRSGGGCPEQALPGRRFCATHAEILDRIRASLELEARTRKRRTALRRCKVTGCDDPRHPGSTWCPFHRDMMDAAESEPAEVEA